ncbi:MAG: mandelate racemase/muconate lactonizing enzyme family protein [Terriglobia bacterium]|jgi:L-alanine-DL-glutamate epimerase-like enolase superfamily enzyme
MSTGIGSRRDFLSATAGSAWAGAGALAFADPGGAAAQAAGIKPGDLPDLTIKEVKVYAVDSGRAGEAAGEGLTRIAAIVTKGGIEGNYTLAERYWHPNWSNLGWLEYAKRLLPGRSVLELPALTSQWTPSKRRVGQLSYASAIDNCLWDILGKAVNLPVYQLLGAYKNRVRAYASSQHLKTVGDFVADLQHAKGEGFTAYKIHPPEMPDGGADYRLDIEVAKAVRQSAGDTFTLLFDSVGVYTRDEAMKVGRVLDQLGFVSFEDPIPTTDIEGLAQLAQALDVPITIGEFIVSPYDYAEYIRRRACDVVRFVVDNIGGITGGMKVARLAECFGMECQPHNWGTALDHAVHFHCELAMPNCVWFEMTQPQGITDRPYFKDKIRIDKDGYIPAPTKPGLGYEIDRNVLDNLTARIER